jgi:hypothetical protein
LARPGTACALVLLAVAQAQVAEPAPDARDYVEAYRYTSSADRKVRDLTHYVRDHAAFNGFAFDPRES